ncbi:MAG TPA: MXAN_5187 C-terminal domain-containing protein [Candidatus Polarisedimenticolaceae bacterium]
MHDAVSPEVEIDLERLENGIRQLKVQYDMFFAGSIPRQPNELRAELERIIKRYSHAPIRKYATRFHFNSLVSRYNSLSELWSKTLRTLEEGDRPAPAVADRGARDESVVATCNIQDPVRDRDYLKVLHAKFLDARRRSGEAESSVSFESFVKGIASQAGRLREKSGCEKIELRVVVKDRKVQLKARPGR